MPSSYGGFYNSLPANGSCMMIGGGASPYGNEFCDIGAQGILSSDASPKFRFSVQGVNSNPLLTFIPWYNTIFQRSQMYGCAGGLQSQSDSSTYLTCSVLENPDDSAYTYDPWWCPFQPDCLSGFNYYWFPEIFAPDDTANWQAGTWNAPPSDHQLFVLPTFNITNRNCTPSPFTGGTIYADNEVRSAYAVWTAGVIPTQCGNDLTQNIVTLISTGPYSLDPGPSSTATLMIDEDNDTISCVYDFQKDLPFEVVVTNVTLTIGDGPIFAQDDIIYSGNPYSPAWQLTNIELATSAGSQGNHSISLLQALPVQVARNYTRFVACTISAFDPATLLPITLSAQNKVVLEYDQSWVNFTYPISGAYAPSCPGSSGNCSPTPAPALPTEKPSQSPSKKPSKVPSAQLSQFPTQSPTALWSGDYSNYCTLPCQLTQPISGVSQITCNCTKTDLVLFKHVHLFVFFKLLTRASVSVNSVANLTYAVAGGTCTSASGGPC